MALDGKPMRLAPWSPRPTPAPAATDPTFAWVRAAASWAGKTHKASRVGDYPLGWSLTLCAYADGLASAAAAVADGTRAFNDPTPRWPHAGSMSSRLPRAVVFDGEPSALRQNFVDGTGTPGRRSAWSKLAAFISGTLTPAGILALSSAAVCPEGDTCIDPLAAGTPWFATSDFSSEVPAYARYWDAGGTQPFRALVGPAGDPAGWHFGETVYVTWSFEEVPADQSTYDGVATTDKTVTVYPYGYNEKVVRAGTTTSNTAHPRPLKLASDVAWAQKCQKVHKRVAWRGIGALTGDVDLPTISNAVTTARAAGLDLTWDHYPSLLSDAMWGYYADQAIFRIKEFFGL